MYVQCIIGCEEPDQIIKATYRVFFLEGLKHLDRDTRTLLFNIHICTTAEDERVDGLMPICTVRNMEIIRVNAHERAELDERSAVKEVTRLWYVMALT